MASSTLVTHCGARTVVWDDLTRVDAPPATRTWFPIKHADVVSTVRQSLEDGGYGVRKAEYALSRGDARMFCTFDLESPLATGVSLAVGVRNSLDKSLPLGFVAGSRVFVCDNMAFRSELLVTRKHTRNGQERFSEAICRAVQSLGQFRDQEAQRIKRFSHTAITDERAESVMLRAYERDIVSHRLLPSVLKEWRTPTFEEFSDRTVWSLLNAFTTVLGNVQKSNPQRFAALTMRLNGLLDESRPEIITAA